MSSPPLFANPFLSTSLAEPAEPAEPAEAVASASRDEVEYAVLRSGPSIVDAEVERADAEVIEVQVRWGRTVLGVAHVALDRALFVGEDARGEGEAVAIAIPEERLGARSIALVDRGEIVIPRGAKATVVRDGVETTLDATTDRLVLAGGTKVRLVLGEDEASAISIHASRVRAGKRTPRAGIVKRGVVGLGVATLVANVGLLVAAAHLPAPSLDDDGAPLDRDTTAELLQMNQAAMRQERADEEAQANAGPKAKDEGSPKEGAAAKGPSGVMGRQDAPVHGGHFAIAGAPPEESVEMRLARTHALIDAGSFGALGALNAVFKQMGPVDASSPYAIGMDPTGAIGNLDGALPADAWGTGGKGTLGLSDGGGNPWGDGLGIGFRDVGFGPPGTRIGGCTKEPCGGVIGTHRPKGVKMIEPGDTIVGAQLPKDVIRRLVRANYPAMRMCYESGLKRDPSLRGTVTTSFVIDTSGAVETAYASGGSMGDERVKGCVAGVFKTISFPEPEGGKVSVTYPVDFGQDQ